ncbi:hypothetical protein BZK37_17795 [Enterococcus casseliflavus]|nr:hypothetical protein BZK37_17795 [Enterococcus casseliflavus]
MSGAVDKSKIANVDFNFEIGKISSDSYDNYRIGESYTIDYGDKVVTAGSLPADTIPFSTVKFRETVFYDDTLTSMVDNYQIDIEEVDGFNYELQPDRYINTIFPYSLASHAIKYDWGRITSYGGSEVITARERTENDPTFPNSDWPNDTIVTSIDGDGTLTYLNETPINEFDTKKLFNVLERGMVVDQLYSVNRPMITHQEVNENGEYLSISKTLFTPEEYEQALTNLNAYNNANDNYDKIFRYILREKSSSDENISVDMNEKILDVFNDRLYIFDIVEQANEFYLKSGNYMDYIPYIEDLNDYIDYSLFEFSPHLPTVSFNNSYKYVNPAGEIRTTVKVNGEASSVDKAVEVTAKDAKAGVAVVDTINYEGLVAGKNYSVTGELYEVSGGQTVGGAKATATKVFTASEATGVWELDFGKVTGLEAGKTYVVYETASSEENLVDSNQDNQPDKKHELTHKDPNDKTQTVVVQEDTLNVTDKNNSNRPVKSNHSTKPNTPKKSLPKTGDATNVAVAIGGMILSLVCFV